MAVWTAPLRDAAGSISATIMAMADVSERRKLEEQLGYSQKMEVVRRLAGGLAHDCSNPLTVINGSGDMMLGTLRPGKRRYTYRDDDLVIKMATRKSTWTRD